MTYETALEQIHSRKTFSSAASLDRIRKLMERLGNPQDQYPTVHVAGTNGKGSTCALIESALRASGRKTGLFTSPYLVDFRERIQIGGSMIPKEDLVRAFETVMEVETALESQGMEPVNEFELVTAIGFLAFAEAKVECAVIEVGLGGRYDPTNVIASPEVCCITPVSFDHTGVLGNTLEQIAYEKAGILKDGVPVAVSRQDPAARQVILAQAEIMGCPVAEAPTLEILSSDRTGLSLRDGAEELHIPLLGSFQAENAATALAACRVLGLSAEDIAAGFRKVSWPGRLQYFPPNLLIDAGHNIAGIEALCGELDRLFSDRPIIAVMAMMRDKDHAQCIPMIAKRCSLLIAATVNLPRSLPPEELALEAEPYCETQTALSVADGLSAAQRQARDHLILVCGSVYAAGEALSAL